MCESNSGTADICEWDNPSRRRGCGGSWLSDGSSSHALLVPGVLHVDAHGGGGLVCGPRQSFCQKSEEIHNRLHNFQLW